MDKSIKPQKIQERDWLGGGPNTTLGKPGGQLDSLKEILLIPQNQENTWRIIKDLRAVATRACPPSTSLTAYEFPSPPKILPLHSNFSYANALCNSFLTTPQESIYTSTNFTEKSKFR